MSKLFIPILVMTIIVIISSVLFAEEITLKTILSNILRAEKGAVGSNYKSLADASIPADGLAVEGRVGIGITTPSNKLQVLNGSDNDLILRVDGANTNSEYIALGIQTGYGVITAGWAGSGNNALVFKTSATSETERMRIDKDGNVGIGTATPMTLLEVAGDMTAFGDIYAGGDVRAGGDVYTTNLYRTGVCLQVPDYVFQPDYQLESIEDHASFMWSKKRLPAIPVPDKTDDGAYRIDISAQQMGILEELEKAHIYIAQLKEIVDKQEERIRTLEKSR